MPENAHPDPEYVAQLRLFSRILELEAKYGFKNSAVTGGGLDQFWPQIARVASEVVKLPPMRRRPYSMLTPVERRRWSEAAKKALFGRLRALSDPTVAVPASINSRAAAPANASRRENPGHKKTKGLDTPIESVRLIHYRTRETLQMLGLESLRDAISHYPLRHIDYRRRTSIASLEIDTEATVAGDVINAQRRFGGKKGSAAVRIRDGTGYLNITWFNMPYMAERWKPGDRIVVSGKVSKYRGRLTMENPEYDELARAGRENHRRLTHAGTIVPVYPLTEGVNQRPVRSGIRQILDHVLRIRLIEDPIPEEILADQGLLTLPEAVKCLHYPHSWHEYHAAVRRMAFDEIFYNQIMALRRRAVWKRPGMSVGVDPDHRAVARFESALDFTLTADQSESINVILKDMSSDSPMARLLQGEVGSGKTVVAIAAMLSATGQQSAMMAPTEVLAEQHFINLIRELDCRPVFDTAAPLYQSELFNTGRNGRQLRAALLTGSMRDRDKDDVRVMCKEGTVDMVVGTHALVQESVRFSDLALVVIDEQQRFGTEQRAALTRISPRPHLLAMTATPIPRTLHMTMYGEMDISTLRTLPHGREKIETRWAETPLEKADAFNEIKRQVRNGRQGFVVCPLIEPSENVPAKAAITEFERLAEGPLRGIRLGLLHGKMRMAQKQEIMDQFRAKRIDVLVATPVIEVGIDIPNATVMIVLSAERFGLSQLHQIRGRVGRGEHSGVCILVSEAENEAGIERLQALVESSDGFELSIKDLKMRGPGRNLQQAQRGWTGWRFAKFDDLQLIERGRSAAEKILQQDLTLRQPQHSMLREALLREMKKSIGAPADYA